MIRILINNNKSKLEGTTKTILQLRKHPLLAIRAKGAFFSPAFQNRQWDGFIRFVTDRGYFDTGKLPQIYQILKEWKEEVELVDTREGFLAERLPKKVGDLKLRDYQIESLKAIAENFVEDVAFPRGVIGVATNGGKTAISAATFLMYNKPTLFILNSKELFNDALKEMTRLLGQERVGYVSSDKGIKWADFTIVMVQTAKARLAEVGHKLAEYPVVLVDEGDLATSNSYRSVLNYTFNSYVRIALSGSAFADPRKKEKNERLRSIFGDMLYTIKNEALIKQGHSAKVKVYIWPGCNIDKNAGYSWQEEYEKGIIKSTRRNTLIAKRVKTHIKKDRLPMLIMVKNHKHVTILYKKLKKLFPKHKVDWVHHTREDRFEVVDNFTKGKVKILVGSFILKRGKNFPLMKALINAAAGDSIANVLQIIGRATRKSDTKKETVMDDFFDTGRYLKRHSKHRLSVYKTEKLEVIEKYY